MKKLNSIQVRISASLLLILLLSVGVSIYLTTSNQKANLLDATQRTLAVNNEMLNATIKNIMLSGEAPIANSTMEDFRKITGFLEFELYRTDGTTAFNDYKTLDFVNSFQNRIMFDPTPRREVKIIENPGFQRVLRNNTPVITLSDDNREMEYFFPILNYADCRVCHGADNFVRGVSHFRVSLSGVYDQVGRATVVLTLYFITVGVVLFGWILLLMRRTIILPVLNIGEVVNIAATGNLGVQVDMNRRDEVGELADRVNHMISGLRERRDLELKNQVIETRLEENRKYLDNIKEGLLLLNTERRITSQYSVYLSRLFRREDIAGLSLSDFIYPDVEGSKTERRELEDFLNILYTNTTADMDMIMSINPLSETTVHVGDGKDIVVRADFLKISNQGDLEYLMVIFEDLTDILRTRNELENQRVKRESELEQIAMILKMGPKVFEGFLAEAEVTFKSLKVNLSKLDEQKYLDGAFRSVHSVKGTARYLDFPRVEDLAHQLEDLFVEIRAGSHKTDASLTEKIAENLALLGDELNTIRRLIERFREFSVGGDREAPTAFRVFSQRVNSMVQDIARELGKKVEFHLDTDLEEIPELSGLQPSIFHLVRNALDHGLEDEYERLAAHKSPAGLLSLKITGDDTWLNVEVEDDGRGLDLPGLEKRGLDTGLLKPGVHLPSQIINMLFRPGFSSRENAGTISGRGVGLDAVKSYIRVLNGRINVKTVKGKGTTFVVSVPRERE